MPSIKLTTIVSRVRRAVSPPSGIGVSVNDPLSKHFNPLNAAALAGLLNNRHAFRKDGLGLRSTDTQGATTVRDLVVAVRTWYIKNGWTIT